MHIFLAELGLHMALLLVWTFGQVEKVPVVIRCWKYETEDKKVKTIFPCVVLKKVLEAGYLSGINTLCVFLKGKQQSCQMGHPAFKPRYHVALFFPAFSDVIYYAVRVRAKFRSSATPTWCFTHLYDQLQWPKAYWSLLISQMSKNQQ